MGDPRRLGTLALRTAREAAEDRIGGVAAQVAFFALLAIPPLLLVLAGTAGFVDVLFGASAKASLEKGLVDALGGFIAPDTMRSVVRPAVETMFERGRGGIISVGALLALWSSSRLVRVLIEAMNIAYDVEDWRPTWRRRLLAIGLTLGGVLAMSVFLPFIVAGPRLGARIDQWAGAGGAVETLWLILYWPVAAAIGVALLATLYHLAPNWKTPWRRDVPGAVLAAVVWVASAFGLRVYVQLALADNAFGPLAAPIVLLLWLWVTWFAVLLGAELNAVIETMWPAPMSRPKVRRWSLRDRGNDGNAGDAPDGAVDGAQVE